MIEKEFTMKKVFLLLALACTLGVTGLTLIDTVDALPAPKAPQYNAYNLPRPADLSSLEDWVAGNYTDHLLRETLKPFTVGDFPAVSFSTRGEAGTDFNLLVDNGATLVLLTTTRLNPTAPDVDEPGDSHLPQLKTDSCDTSTNRCNCVFYARCKVPSLPYGLTYYSDKVRIINSSSPSVGSVAIMNVGAPYGHVGVVTTVKKDARGQVTSITINEANYSACKLTTRSGLPSTLKVTGYFKP